MAVYSSSTQASFDLVVNVQSPSAATRDSKGNFTTWGAVRAIHVREELEAMRVPTATGEEKQTLYLWMVLEEVKLTDRVWLAADSSADPVGTPPDLKKARTPANVERFTGPGAHWAVRI